MTDFDGHGLPEAAGRVVFSGAGRDYRWSDVIAAAQVRGDWAALEQRVSSSPVGAGGGSVDEWRRGRGLLSADETAAWLARWDLELADVRRHVGNGTTPEPLSPDRRDRATWAEAVCSGALNGLASELAAGVAVATDPPGAGSLLDASVFMDLEAEFARWRAEIEGSEAVFSLIEANATGWASVVARALAFRDLEAAREAVLCVRCDGLSLDEVAELCGGEVREVRGLADEIEEPARGLVASALPGELLGPFAQASAYGVLCLLSKERPQPDDPVVLARARKLAVTRAIDRASAARIVWHDRL